MLRSSIPRGLPARLALAVAALAIGLGAVALAQGPARSTTYAGQSTVAAVVGPLAGFTLMAAGAVLSFIRSSRLIGGLALLAGIAWFAPVWVGWQGGPPIARSLGMVTAGFTFPLMVHLAVAYPDGRADTPASRFLIRACYVEAVVVALGLAFVRDPFFDPDCWANCTDNAFLLRSVPGLARAIEVVDRGFVVAAAAALVALGLGRLVRSSGPARQVQLPVAGPAMLFAGGVAVRAIALQQAPKEDPSEPLFYWIFLITSAALILVAGGLLWGFVRTRLQRRAVGQIVASLGEAPAPGLLEPALATAVGDPGLRISYWLPTARKFVDANGTAVAEPREAPGRAVTALARDDRRVALVSHTSGLPLIEAELGPAVRLALENERLRAEGLAQLEDLRASRARIVETGDEERRRLERDLHDGAQQRLLAVSYEIRLALATAEADGDVAAAAVLAAALDEARAALEELRELAHGIYPAILEEAGLATAIATLRDTGPIPLEVGDVSDERYSAPVETAAYTVVVEALEDAARRHASHATVSAVRADGLLVIRVDDDGSARASAMVQVDDRVGALGGRLEVGPTNLSAVIPCA